MAGSIAKHVSDEQPVALDDASRAADRRSLLDYVREGDMLVVWKLDRLGRPLAGLLKSLRGWWSSRPCA
jgi:DNA invertase Pin-like site-specific DNA recombinase